MSTIDQVLAQIDSDLDNSLNRLFDFLKIKSISADPAYIDDCRNAANWLARELSEIGIESSVRDTTGQPMVVGHRKTGKPGPHVLFYGHYDVQPVDPLDLWDTDPFEPRIVTREDGSKIIVARGSADDKGQLMTFVEAARAYMAVQGDLPLDVTVFFEGEEESGSPSLEPFLEANKNELSCDLALVCDTGMWDENTPAISVMLRGLVGEEITIKAANRDLHSGHYGGSATNPNHIIAKIIADMRDDTGKITLDGFYDGVIDVPEDVMKMWDTLGFSTDVFLGDIGLSVPCGEQDRTPLEHIWTRPTAEVNGMWGGYLGAGSKTVIPAEAHAKFTFRLVGDQDPEKIVEAFRAHVRARIPEDCSVEFTSHGASPALRLDFNMPSLAKGKKALQDEWGTEAALIGMGGSIPVVGDFKRSLNMDTMLIGFGLEDDSIHSPNEKYNLKSFHKGIRSWARVLDELAQG
ncbi:acetylornithine deacetylase/succinyl-diaminopimelate desuccinylase-like protein [Roseibium hamelinense]|uniref:Acetylornithine deacetylase/succinyl-diaminopimelate desuccinylase-like protein n=1 Tax=Roseibium hamelinense TaxID=150831 RepID=A0A562TJQ7_9HYPH|nr:dipeptidase [Roseibium hamelinense]MTI42601.1 dipeptidase [Roseibium hamelinense]TWI93346.1 acetylornithine deacetylase/succinyl-diaminopimelate desuccinylase-like protein [Roseibium hamelinense]